MDGIDETSSASPLPRQLRFGISIIFIVYGSGAPSEERQFRAHPETRFQIRDRDRQWFRNSVAGIHRDRSIRDAVRDGTPVKLYRVSKPSSANYNLVAIKSPLNSQI